MRNTACSCSTSPATQLSKMDALAVRDLVVMAISFGDHGERRFELGARSYNPGDFELNVSYQRAGTRRTMRLAQGHRMRSVTIAIDPAALRRRAGRGEQVLPSMVQQLLEDGESAMVLGCASLRVRLLAEALLDQADNPIIAPRPVPEGQVLRVAVDGARHALPSRRAARGRQQSRRQRVDAAGSRAARHRGRTDARPYDDRAGATGGHESNQAARRIQRDVRCNYRGLPHCAVYAARAGHAGGGGAYRSPKSPTRLDMRAPRVSALRSSARSA